MWKRYLTFVIAMLLVFHTVALSVYAGGETGAVQSGIVNPETEEEAGSEEADDSQDKGESDAGQKEEAEPEPEQPEQEETGENEGEKQPEESTEKGAKQPIESEDKEKLGENAGEDVEETGEKNPEDNEGEETEKADEVNSEESGEEDSKESEEMNLEEPGKEEKVELEGVYQFGGAPSDSEGIELFSFEYSKDMDIAEVEAYIYPQLKARRAKIVIENYHEEFSASDVISSLLNEHPDLYYVRKGFYESVSYVDYTLTLRMTYDNTLDDKAFRLATERALASIRPGMSDLEKAVVLHDYLAVNCEYDQENYEADTIPAMSYTAYGVLVNRIAVCQGYALAYKYLLNEAGIKCYMVTSSLMKHAWNLIELDGAFYHVDVTWADPVFDLVGRVQHQYMFRSDQAFMNPGNSGMEKHYLWNVTEGNHVVNYKATDTRYDNAFWKNCYSSLILEGVDCYYISSDQRIKKASLAEPSAAGIDIGGTGTYTEPGQASGLFILNGRLYYNTKNSICSIGLTGNDGRTEFYGDGSKGYLYGCAFAQGKVLYAQGYKTNFQKVPVWTLEVEELLALVPVESITLNHEKLVLKIGETALLEAVVSPDNAHESGVIWLNSNEAVVSMENGKVTALEAGVCIITAVAGDKEAVCQVTVTDTGNEERIAGGRCKNIVWEINMDGKLRVEGTGEFADSTEIGRAPWSDYGRSILSAEIKVADLKDASYMFSDCTELVSLDIRNFDTSCVTDMKYMFRNCCSLKTLDLSSFETAQVTDMKYMFYLCTGLEDLDVSGFDTRNVKCMTGMFKECTNLDSLDLSNFNTGNVVYMDSMFAHCTNMAGLNLDGFDTHKVAWTRFMFYHCESLVSLDLSSFDASHVSLMDFMFAYCSSLAELDVSSFQTDSVTDMECMFYGCSSVKELDVSGFRTDKVTGTDMSKMFYGCKSLTSLDLRSFDTSGVTDMGYLFCYCENLKSLDLSSFDTRSVTITGCMFYGCKSLTTLDLSNFDTSRVIYSGHEFVVCNCLEKIYTPYNLMQSIILPGVEGDIWYQPDGAKITELPKKLGYSIMITKNQIPVIEKSYLSATKRKTVYSCGDVLNIDDLDVKCHESDGSVRRITDFDTNVDEIDMSSIGEKELVIRYQELTAVVHIMVNEKTIVKERVTIDADFVNCVYTGRKADCNKRISVMAKDGTRLTDKVKVTCTYGGTQADGSVYVECDKAPVNAGKYLVTVVVADEMYTGSAKYRFEVRKASLRIKASNIKLRTEEALPERYQYEAEGLLYADRLLREPSFVCDAVAAKEGVYDIIPQGADAGMNYEIAYIKGRMYIADDSDVQPEDIPETGKIPEGLWIAGLRDYTYTGKAIKQEQMRVYDDKKLLQPGKDYTLTYKNNVKANNASDRKTAPAVYIRGKGNYTDTYTAVFQILPVKLSDVTAEDITAAYNRKVQKKVPILIYNGRKLENKKDFTLSYPALEQELPDAFKAADCYDIVVTAKPGGNFTGSKTVRLTITDKTLMTAVRVKKLPSQVYDGTAKVPKLTVFKGKTVLTEGVDYEVAYKNNIEVGIASAILTGTGDYAGTKRVTFQITGTPIKGAVVEGLEERQYSAVAWEPELRVTLKGKRLLKDTDYKVSYAKNRNAGKASIVVEGIGAYTGMIRKSFKITAYDLENIEGQLKQDMTCKYLKGGCRPKVKLQFAGEMLKEGVDYTVSYKNNRSVTTAETRRLPSITIKGKGNFKGSITQNFNIVGRMLGDGEVMVDMSAADMVFVDRPGKYMSKPVLIDADGKKLDQGRDYEKQLVYAREDGKVLGVGDRPNVGDVVIVTAQGKGAYLGSLSARYRITEKSFDRAKIKIAPQIYTGREIILNENDENVISVAIGKTLLVPGVDYEIVEDSYKNNMKKGTAMVKISGKGNYGGTRMVTFKIVSKKLIFSTVE